MRAANNQDDYNPPSAASTAIIHSWPLVTGVGTHDTWGRDLEWEMHPPLPETPKEEKPRVKSRWLEKQKKQHGWSKRD